MSRWPLLVALGVVLRCAPAAPPAPAPLPGTASSTPATAEPSAPQAPTSSDTPLVPDGPYRLTWSVKDDTRSGITRLAPWGDVVVAQNDGTVLVLAGHDGSELSKKERVCRSPDAATFVDYRTLLILCNDEVVELRFPDGATRRRAAPYDSLHGAAVTATAFAVAAWDDVRVYRRATFEVLFDKKLPDVSRIRLSPDGERLAISTRKHDLAVYEVHSGKVLATFDHYVRSMAFSADGGELALATSSSLVVLDASSGKVLRQVPELRSIDSLTYVTPDLLGGIDHYGVTLVPRTAKWQRMPVKEGMRLTRHVMFSPDATLACAKGSWGELGCFSTRPPQPSGFPAVATAPVVADKSDEMTARICASSAMCVASGVCAASAKGRCVAGSSAACKKSSQCRWLGKCEAKHGTCVATAKSCDTAKACQPGDLCKFHDGACVAGDAVCQKTVACRERGLCTSDAGTCVIGSEQDCYQSLECAAKGTCSFKDGACVVGKDEDCRQSELCQSKSYWGGGDCSARDGRCVRASDYGCRRTRNCREAGECSFDEEEGCVAKKDVDCKKSTDCKEDGRCSWVQLDATKQFGVCGVVEPKGCQGTEACDKQGRCLPALARCVDKCTSPWACRVFGLCLQRGGRCVGTAASCKRSLGCKKKQLCRLSKEGLCVR